MYSKKSLRSWMLGLVFLGTAILLVDCSRFFNKSDNVQRSDVIVLNPREFVCLKKWPDQVKLYFEDQLDEASTVGIFTCLQSSLDSFLSLAKGANPNQFSSQDLQYYFNQYLLKNYQINDNFMTEIMKIKTVMVGGSPTSLNRSEIGLIRKTISIFKDESIRLRGHWKTLLLAETPALVSENSLQETSRLSKESILRLLVDSKIVDVNYSWNDFRLFLNELENFLKATDTVGSIKRWIPLTDSLRQLFISEHPDLHTQADWQEAASWTADAYNNLAYYHYMIRPSRFDSDEIWSKIITLADSLLNLIETAPQMKRTGLLPVSGIDNVIDNVFDLKLFKTVLVSSDIKNLYKKILAHVLQNPRTGEHIEGQDVLGLQSADLPRIRFEYNVWKIAQLQIISDFKNKKEQKISDLVKSLKAIDINKKLSELKIPKVQIKPLKKTWKDWLRLVDLNNPLSFDPELKLQIPSSKNGVYNFDSLSNLNQIRTLVRMVQMGYGEFRTGDVWDAILTKNGMTKWESDFREFGLKIGFLDPRQSGSAKRAYNEGKYFAFSSVGQDELTATQLTELLSMMIAGGRHTTTQMYGVFKEKNKDRRCLLEVIDVLNQRKVDEACFTQTFKEDFGLFYSNLASLNDQIQKEQISVDEILRELQIISKIKGKTPGTVEYGEIRTMNVVLNYLEALMAVYDTNRDQLLNEQELLGAYPRFETIVRKLNPLGDTLAVDAFLYIVYEGEFPDIKKNPNGNWWDKIKNGWRKAIEGTKFGAFVIKRHIGSLGSVNRINLLKVISLIKTATEGSTMAAADTTADTTESLQ